jgi:hypothetical protein
MNMAFKMQSMGKITAKLESHRLIEVCVKIDRKYNRKNTASTTVYKWSNGKFNIPILIISNAAKLIKPEQSKK